jgi:small subunit ribosomal protein S6e
MGLNPSNSLVAEAHTLYGGVRAPLVLGNNCWRKKMPVELKFKVVLGEKDGKSVQVELEGEAAEQLMRKRIGESISGEKIGYPGYEFVLSGGSDKAGFPMRKGIQERRKRILATGGVGFSGLKRTIGKKKSRRKQKGIQKRITVCGEMVDTTTVQINLKVTKQGPKPLIDVPAASEEVPKAEK